MKNFITINSQQIELTEEQVKQIIDDYGIRQKQLSEYTAGNTVKIGDFEMAVLEQLDGQTALILKGAYGEDTAFGKKNNDYNGSIVDEKCQQFAQALAEIIGWDNIVLHEVDLVSNDGLKCYGTVDRRASLLTADLYRKYVDILDKFKLESWWWLATPWSTKRHESDAYALCVSPSGDIDGGNYYYGHYAVRPFCILKSTIFVSG